jgi:hypothetical protein
MHPINAEILEKVIETYQRGGRTVAVDAARAFGQRLIATDPRFDSASDAAEFLRNALWHGGYVW